VTKKRQNTANFNEFTKFWGDLAQIKLFLRHKETNHKKNAHN